MNIIVLDTETTGLLVPMASSIDKQPFIVELYAIKLDKDLKRTEMLSFRCKPPIPIPEKATLIRGISNEDVSNGHPSVSYLETLSKFFLNTDILVGHNVIYDATVLYCELVRLGKTMQFPWPYKNVCTVEIAQQQFGSRRTLADLHMELFGVSFDGAHNAATDCQVTAKCFVEMVSREWITL